MKIGYHISKTNLEKSIKDANEAQANAIQLFISSPKVWAVCNLKQNEIKELLEYKKTNYLVIHGKYLYNFCRTNENQTKSLIRELEEADKLMSDVVIHQGKNLSELKLTNEEACKVYVDNIKKILKETDNLVNKPKIILENSARQGSEIGYSLEELSYIWNLFDNNNKQRLGICIDLCHIFVAGELDIRKKEDVKLFFKEFEKLIGLKHLLVFHLNDSSIKYNGHNDHHQDMKAGYITNTKLGGNIEGLQIIVKKATKLNIPMILETPADNVSYLDQIIFIKELTKTRQ